MKNLLITIDGPAGSGKSTLCRLLAQKLGLTCLDTGAMYRAVAWKIRETRREKEAGPALVAFIRLLNLGLEGTGPGQRVLVDGEDISQAIRTPEMSQLASVLSARPEVRLVLTEKQRQLGKQGGLVAEGRDMGTVVFPRADPKFFLQASLEVRAERRFQELLQAGYRMTLVEVQQDLARRDRQDSERKLAPLRPAPDARIIDTSRLPIEGVLEQMLLALHPDRTRPRG